MQKHEKVSKVVAIFNNHQVLNNVLTELNGAGFSKDEISVLVKAQPDSTTDVVSSDVRTYSTATYPRTEECLRTDERVYDAPSYATSTYDISPQGGVLDPGTMSQPGYRPELENTYDTENINVRHERLNEDVVVDNQLKDNIEAQHDAKVKDPEALMKDALAGGALGLVAGMAALLIPGVGAIFAAGPIAAAAGAMATGAALGTTAGAVVGLLRDEGIPEDRVQVYRQAFDDGKAVIILTPRHEDADPMTHLDRARVILSGHRPEMLELI